MRRIICTLLICFSFSFFSSLAYAEDLVIFGDSLSDTGNLSNLPGGPFPAPYYLGSRVSNGPVAVEVMASLLGLNADASRHLNGNYDGNNFSVATARARGSSPIDLKNQITAFLFLNLGEAPAENIYLVFIGGNDVRDARGERVGVANKIIRDTRTEIDLQLRRLISAGATSVMLVNLPDVGVIPESVAIGLEKGGKRFQRAASRYSRRLNTMLKQVVRKIEKDTTVDLILFDLDAVIDQVSLDASARGFTYLETPCIDADSLDYFPACNGGAAVDQFVFFDEIHPTARTHEIIGRMLAAYAPKPVTP